jgi:hypothetical protein
LIASVKLGEWTRLRSSKLSWRWSLTPSRLPPVRRAAVATVPVRTTRRPFPLLLQSPASRGRGHWACGVTLTPSPTPTWSPRSAALPALTLLFAQPPLFCDGVVLHLTSASVRFGAACWFQRRTTRRMLASHVWPLQRAFPSAVNISPSNGNGMLWTSAASSQCHLEALRMPHTFP